MKKHTSQHVIPHPNGGWSVKKGGSMRSTKRFKTQKKAIEFARKVSKNQNAELYIHRKDGVIRRKNSYGKDPHPPNG